MAEPEIFILPTGDELVEEVCDLLSRSAREAIAARGRFTLALSGGSTPKALYQRLASDEWNAQFDWRRIVVLFGDDRAVAPDDALSNYRMAREALLDHVPVQVERIETEDPNLENAAQAYEDAVRDLGTSLDVVLLGLGSDGHTASLFPHSPQLDAGGRLVVATPIASLEPHVRRVTFTFDLINAARAVWFLATGADKAARVAQVVSGPRDVVALPAQGVTPTHGKLVWFLDEGAARELKRDS